MFRITLIILLCFSVFTAPAFSAPDTEAGTGLNEIRVPEWEFSLATGYGVLENPIAGKQDGETYLLPSFSYYGKRFFLSNLPAVYTLLETDSFYLDLVARPNEDGLYFLLDKHSEATGGLLSNFLTQLTAPDPADMERQVSIVAGPSVTLVSDWVDVSFSWFHDISDVHHGSETHLSFDKQYPLLGGAVGFGIGAVQKDADLVEYYYHFTEQEADVFYSRYISKFPPADTTDQYARLHFSYPLSKHLELRLAARYNRFDLDGRNPRFIETPETLSWFAGLQYRIGSGG